MKNFYLSCKECVLEGPRHFYGCFYLGPFNNSQSLTIANALRRTLLAEISGLGIVSVQMDGVNHEYSTFLGMRESILDFLLNLKEIILCYDSISFPKENLNSSFIGYLNVSGPGIVRAKDFKLPSFLKCVDPDQYLATLSENGRLNIKFEISESLGKISVDNQFLGVQKNREKNSPIFQLDPVFPPIKKVNYTIENYDTFQFNPNNQVISLELWTNGSIHPRDALYKALYILNSTFAKMAKMRVLNNLYRKSILKSNQNYSIVQKKTFYNINLRRSINSKNWAKKTKSFYQEFQYQTKDETDFFKWNNETILILEKKELQNQTIKVLNFPFRIENCLIQSSIMTIKDLFNCDFKKIPGLGTQSIKFIQKKLFLWQNENL